MVKLPQPCPKCGAPIMNYGTVCAKCGYEPATIRATLEAGGKAGDGELVVALRTECDDLRGLLTDARWYVQEAVTEVGGKPDIDLLEAIDAALSRAEANASGGGDDLDAARWRALMACPRIRMMGSAGIEPKTGERTQGNYVHFEAGFWSEGPVNDEQSGDFSTQWGKRALTALADAIIAAAPTSTAGGA